MLARMLCVTAIIAVVGCQQSTTPVATAPKTPTQQVIGIDTSSNSQNGVTSIVPIESVEIQMASDEIESLPIGSTCVVELIGSQRELHGRVAQVDERTLVLADAQEHVPYSSTQGIPIVDKIPYVNRLFKNTGVAMRINPIDSPAIDASEINYVTLQTTIVQ